MTRFARHGDGRKKPHHGTNWSNLKTQQNSDTDKQLRQIKDKTFIKDRKQKQKNGGRNRNRGRSVVLKCYNCLNEGHKASECPEPKQNIGEITCHVCKKTGHKASSCPDNPEGLKMEWKKVKRSEHRRLKRQDQVLTNTICFNCRETGHQLSECPKSKKDMEHGTGICFKCGSTEHSVHKCKAKVPPGEYPFAKCFICEETGHLSKQCPDNPRGLYPKGGCCNECGSVEHLKRDCPEYQEQQGISSIKLQLMDNMTSLDSDDLPATESTEVMPVAKKKPKLVKF